MHKIGQAEGEWRANLNQRVQNGRSFHAHGRLPFFPFVASYAGAKKSYRQFIPMAESEETQLPQSSIRDVRKKDTIDTYIHT